jgi:hypothetical protein
MTPADASPAPSDPLFEGLTYGRAWNAFWLGLASLFCCGPLAGIPAVFVGAQALSDITASGGRLKGRGMAWIGVILGALGTVASTGAVAYYRAR